MIGPIILAVRLERSDVKCRQQNTRQLQVNSEKTRFKIRSKKTKKLTIRKV